MINDRRAPYILPDWAAGHCAPELQQEKFEQWALVELFGHSRIAGLITEQTIGGCSFLRVDVPEADGAPAFTKLYGNGAIYGISFVTEDIARAAAKSYRVRPIQSYELPALANAIPDDDLPI